MKKILEKERLIVSVLQLAIAVSYAIEAICAPNGSWLYMMALVWIINAAIGFRFHSPTSIPKAELILYGMITVACLFAFAVCENGFDYAENSSLALYTCSKMFFAWQVLKSPRIKKKTRRIPVEPDWSFKHLIEELVRKDCKRFSFKNYDVVVDGKVLSESELEKPIWQMADAIKEFDLVPKIKE